MHAGPSHSFISRPFGTVIFDEEIRTHVQTLTLPLKSFLEFLLDDEMESMLQDCNLQDKMSDLQANHRQSAQGFLDGHCGRYSTAMTTGQQANPVAIALGGAVGVIVTGALLKLFYDNHKLSNELERKNTYVDIVAKFDAWSTRRMVQLSRAMDGELPPEMAQGHFTHLEDTVAMRLTNVHCEGGFLNETLTRYVAAPRFLHSASSVQAIGEFSLEQAAFLTPKIPLFAVDHYGQQWGLDKSVCRLLASTLHVCPLAARLHSNCSLDSWLNCPVLYEEIDETFVRVYEENTSTFTVYSKIKYYEHNEQEKKMPPSGSLRVTLKSSHIFRIGRTELTGAAESVVITPLMPKEFFDLKRLLYKKSATLTAVKGQNGLYGFAHELEDAGLSIAAFFSTT